MSKFKAERANKQDISKALDVVAKQLGVDRASLENNLLGSTESTLLGHKKDSGDIDIAIPPDMNISLEDTDKKMLALTNGEGYLNKGSKIGSYAVDVGGKKVQVDLMFVNNKDWAKFIYHSSHGRGSNYPGVVRNLILMAAVRHTHEPNKDMLIKRGEDVIARASRAIKLDVGLERLFKMSKKSPKSGKYGGMQKVEPDVLQDYANELAGFDVKFSHDPEIIDDPDLATAFVFGPSVKAKDIMTAEQLIGQIKKLKNAAEIFKAACEDLEKSKLPVPAEMS